jgi:hypothetical protein
MIFGFTTIALILYFILARNPGRPDRWDSWLGGRGYARDHRQDIVQTCAPFTYIGFSTGRKSGRKRETERERTRAWRFVNPVLDPQNGLIEKQLAVRRPTFGHFFHHEGTFDLRGLYQNKPLFIRLVRSPEFQHW